MRPDSPDGVLLIDKPRGPTSHDAVQTVKSSMGARKAGHLGTLDPMATGLLVVCINGATKIAQFLKDNKKEYVARMVLGVETDTLDADGKVIATADPGGLSESEIIEAFEAFKGSIEQRPPSYSAVKVSGIPMHRLARRGVQVEAPIRTVQIVELEIVSISLPRVEFRALVSAGTYIRTLAADIGARLKVGAHLDDLKRTRSGHFRIEDAITLAELETGPGSMKAYEMLIAIPEALQGLTTITVTGEASARLSNGRGLTAGDFESGLAVITGDGGKELAKAVDSKGFIVAVMKNTNESAGPEEKGVPLWRPVRVWNN